MNLTDISLIKLEMDRLDEKYHRALTKKEVAHELGGISIKTLDKRIEKSEDIPRYKQLRTGRLMFPLAAVAEYLTGDLIQTI